jgi:alkylation response protein AidB-like acyl-CoA dehydrogenase
VDFDWSPELLALQTEARAVGRAAAAERDVREDAWLIGTSRAFSLELAERGWLGMTWPVDEGGHGRRLERFVVLEALISADAPVAPSWFADRQIEPTLRVRRTQQRAVPARDRGDRRGRRDERARRRERRGVDPPGTAPTGSAAGLDERGSRADWCLIAAPTRRRPTPVSLVVDLHSPGVSISPISDGQPPLLRVVYTDVRVPATNLVGTENGSFRQVMRQMEHERGGIDRLVSNRALYEEHVALADRDDPRVRQELAALESGYRIGRLLVLREVLGQAKPGFSAATKTFCTEFEQRVAEFCLRVAGPDALLTSRVARNACYAPAYTIMGGTTSILRNILGERLLGLPREPR